MFPSTELITILKAHRSSYGAPSLTCRTASGECRGRLSLHRYKERLAGHRLLRSILLGCYTYKRVHLPKACPSFRNDALDPYAREDDAIGEVPSPSPGCRSFLARSLLEADCRTRLEPRAAQRAQVPRVRKLATLQSCGPHSFTAIWHNTRTESPLKARAAEQCRTGERQIGLSRHSL